VQVRNHIKSAVRLSVVRKAVLVFYSSREQFSYAYTVV